LSWQRLPCRRFSNFPASILFALHVVLFENKFLPLRYHLPANPQLAAAVKSVVPQSPPRAFNNFACPLSGPWCHGGHFGFRYVTIAIQNEIFKIFPDHPEIVPIAKKLFEDGHAVRACFVGIKFRIANSCEQFVFFTWRYNAAALLAIVLLFCHYNLLF
jgi:hypothetical protein